jgi:cytochrome c-type biogenesis protein CcmH
MFKRFFTLMLVTIIYSLVSANEPQVIYPFEDSVHEERFLSLLNELRCPKCQGSNLAGSNAPIANDLKREVYGLVKSGKTEEEVKTYLIDRYGNFIVYDPPFRPDTYVLWFGPLFIFLITLSIILVILLTRFSNSKRNQ